MKCYKHLAALVLLVIAMSATASLAKAQKMDGGSERLMKSADVDFLLSAAQSAHAVAQLSQLGLQKNLSPGAKTLAQQLVDDHTRLDSQLEVAAKGQDLTLPQTPGVKGQALYYKLDHQSAKPFERTYLKALMQENRREAKACKREIKKGSDPVVKQLAQERLPVIQNHLEQVKSASRDGAIGRS